MVSRTRRWLGLALASTVIYMVVLLLSPWFKGPLSLSLYTGAAQEDVVSERESTRTPTLKPSKLNDPSNVIGEAPESQSPMSAHESERRWGTKMFENNAALFEGLYKRNYSSHYCIYGVQRDSDFDWTRRRCVFRRLGLDKDGTLVYHMDPAAKHDGIAGFEQRRKMSSKVFAGFEFPIRISHDPIDEISNYPKGNAFPEKVEQALILASATNELALVPGHDWDYSWGAFNCMLDTGLLSLDNQIVLTTPSNKKGRFSKIWSSYVRSVSNKDAFVQSHKGSILPFAMVCPKSVDFLLWPTVRNGFLLHLVRDRAFRLLDIPIPPPVRVQTRSPDLEPRITLRRKFRGGHYFLNPDEILRHLKEKCPTCSVELFYPATMSLKEELQIISSTHVYITPSGGGSLSAFVLADGAALILGDACHPTFDGITHNHTAYFEPDQRVHCLHLDGPMWDAIPMFFTRYITSTTVQVRDPSQYHSFHRYNFNVSLELLDRYVNDAFRSMGFDKFVYD